MGKKSSKLRLVFLLIAAFALCLSACGEKHVHVYEDGWFFDEYFHWRKATCGDIEIGLRGKHNYVDGVCTLCGYDKNDPSGSAKPENPEEPDEPDDSDDPKEPEVPENPDDPDNPKDPENPDTPSNPDSPDTPDAPDQPEPSYGKYTLGQTERDGNLQYTELFDQGTLVGYSVSKAEEGTIKGALTIGKYKNMPVLEVGEFGFSGEEIVSILLPAGLETIGYGAFSDCTALQSVEIPSSVTLIDMQAFCRCTALTSVALPKLDSIAYELFYRCDHLEKIEIPEGVKTIEKLAFYRCSRLREVSLPSTLNFIGKEAFNGCEGFDTVEIADIEKWCGVSLADETANPLRRCRNLTSKGEIVTHIKFPNLSKVSKYLFNGCEALKSIEIPASVKDVEAYAFSNTGLEEIIFEEGLVNIYERAFAECKNLKEVVLPDSVKYIEESAFYNCFSLQKFVFGRGIGTVGSYAVGVAQYYNPNPDFKFYYRGSAAEWSRVNRGGSWNYRRTNEIQYDYRDGE